MEEPVRRHHLHSLTATITSLPPRLRFEKNFLTYDIITSSLLKEFRVNLVEYDHQPLPKRRRQLSVPSVYTDQFVSQGRAEIEMPEFSILLLIRTNYPASSPRIIRSSCNELNNEPWRMLYDEMLTKFKLSLCGITVIPSLGGR